MKKTRKITYRKWGVPAILISGKWLTRLLGWKIGDTIDIEVQPDGLKIKTSKKAKLPGEGVSGNINTSMIALSAPRSILITHGN